MAFVDTFDSLANNLDIGNVLNNRLAQSVDKSVTVTVSNNTFTIDPNTANLFNVNVTSNSSIVLSSLDSVYTNSGSTISILLTLDSDSLAVTWPNTIKWKDEAAPTLTHTNLITLLHFGDNNWYGGCVEIDDDFPVEE